ncbi:MAG: phosphopentomutase [Armatimonadetes bacterium]|nr:phosphopentomutase [Armatimonadota bacterium]
MRTQFDRVFLLVMDGCGAGPAPDAARFGDVGVNEGDTLVHIARAVGGLRVPRLRSLGLGNTLPLDGAPPVENPAGSYGRLQERSLGGKDTVTGHWEMMGIRTTTPFPTYPAGFPEEVIRPFETAIGSEILGNYASSGTVILDQLGAEHLETGRPILYTSADSVFQIAAHEERVPVERLYEICRIARGLLQGEHSVQRVIARPFEGKLGSFRRTERRKDFPLSPPENVIDRLREAGVFVAGVGVIPEIFDGRGFDYRNRTQTNREHFEATLELLDQPSGFIFVNFEDFDMLYGHRNNPRGFAAALEVFDGYVGELMDRLGPRDLLMLCADHGNDPTTPSTDHTREYSPLLVYSPGRPGARNYGDRDTYADLGATVAEALGARPVGEGTSLL